MKYFIVVNPLSGSGRSGRMLKQVLRTLDDRQCGFRYSVAVTYRGILELARHASANGYDRIIAMGGDGTINATISGMFNDQGSRYSSAQLGIIYTGTSPDFCKSFGIPLVTEEALRVIKDGEARMIRIGKIQLRSRPDDDQPDVRFFACCANIGLGAGVAAGANRLRQYMGDVPGTLVALIRQLITYKAAEINIIVDGKQMNLQKVVNISVGRTKYIASGIKMPAGISDDDPGFYILSAANVSMVHLPSLLRQAYSGSDKQGMFLQHDYGKTIRISGGRPGIEVEFDGDPAGFLPCSIEVAPDPLEILTAGDMKN